MSMLRAVVSAARGAGAILMEESGPGIKVSRKSSHELVTNADIRSEGFLREALAEVDPEAGFLGEESSGGIFPDPPFWIVDPLDGTNNYAHGFPMFSVSIAYWDGSRMLCGCVYDPVRDECFTAEADSGTYLDGRRTGCSAVSELSECLVATGFPYHRRQDNIGVDLKPLEFFLGRVQGVRRGGSAALDLAYVACGRLDGFFEQYLKPWDMAAGYLLVKEAGGTVSAYEGGPWSPASGGVLASGRGVHELMRAGLLHG